MTEILPVLPLDDEVVLPGMVVPLDLSDSEVRAAIEAAQATGAKKPHVLLVPRIDGHYGAVGVSAVVEQVGRLPGGEPAAVVRGRLARPRGHRHDRSRRGPVGRGHDRAEEHRKSPTPR